MTKAATDAAKAAAEPAVADQSAEIEALKAKIAALEAAKPAAPVTTLAAINNDAASAAVLAARGKEPKTYRALADGTDINQGIIKEGEVFSTTQPQGSWMELIDAAED
jgi:hypothetical protein